jgi:translation initiation factor IF-3
LAGEDCCQRRYVISTNYRHNEQIRISPVRLITSTDDQLGIVPTAEALRMAREAGMDLVEVAPAARPPVCKIMDYGKWRYTQQKKEDRSRANSKSGQLKELKFRTVKIGDNDLMVKVNHAREFLKEGNKVQFTLQFRGRELSHIDLGRALLKKVKEALREVSKVERDSKMEGKRMTLVLQPEFKSGGQKKTAASPGAGERLNIPAPRPAAAPGAPAATAAAAPAPAPAAPAPTGNA